MNTILQDIRYAIRILPKCPAFTLVVVITLALGIGANAAIFMLVNNVVLRPLPFQNPDRLTVIDVSVHGENWPRRCHAATLPEIGLFAEQNGVFTAVGGFQETEFTLTGIETPERLRGVYVTSGFFRALGIKPVAGRFLLPEEDAAGGPKVAVLVHSLWRRCFNEDPSLIGQSIMLDKTSYIVTGVLPPEFEFPLTIEDAEVFTPLPNDEGQYEAQGWRMLTAVGRLASDISLNDAQARFNALAARLEQQDSQNNHACMIELRPLHECVVSDSRPLMMLLSGTVGMVLLIACANVANLMLARSSERRREYAVRQALGAGRFRLFRQILTESVILGLAGGLLGLVLASWSTNSLGLLLPKDLPRTAGMGIDTQVFLFTLILSVLTGVLFGLPGALRAARFNVNAALKGGGGRGSSSESPRLRQFLVVSEVALACALLIGAGLLLRSFTRLMDVDPGFVVRDTLTFKMLLDRPSAEQVSLCDTIVQRLSNLPGVRQVGISDGTPFTDGGWSSSFKIVGDEDRVFNAKPAAAYSAINPDYFSAMGIPLLRGRCFTEHDIRATSEVMIVNETFARRFFPNEIPLGKSIKPYASASCGGPDSYEIVGVVGDVRDQALDADSRAHMYVPYAQHPRGYVNFVLRTDRSSMSLIPTIRNELAVLAPDQAPYQFATAEQHLMSSVANRRCPMLLLTVCAALAMTLAAIGIYGMLSYTVSRRTHEIGIRMAMGACSGDVLRLVVGHALLLALIGVGVGSIVAAAASRTLANLLYEIKALDPSTYLGVAVLLMITALAAGYIPARRATKVDPITALRCE